ncbi:MAG: glycosyltransferase family 39 protein [Pyrinomonadaceae bacterium]
MQQLPITTAGTKPEQFSDDLFFAKNKKIAGLILAVFMAMGFGLRVNQLGAESLGEDELNKLETVGEYRQNVLSGKNGEHPFLMKGLQTVSVSAAEKINSIAASASLNISEEAALRFPVALFGTFTALLIFLLVSELFGRSIGLVSAIFWTIEPIAIASDRIAKEDSLVVFFFLFTMYFWVRGQTEAEHGNKNWTRYAWTAAAGFAGLMASKYYPHLLAILGGYYIVFQYIPATKWRMEGVRWLKFFAVMGFAFLILNPTILLPDTWREMLKFSSENRIGHDSYEFMGGLYPNKMTAWFAGVPWTFYYVFLAVKTSLPVLVLFLMGLPVLFRKKLGDGRFLLYLWAFMWFVPFSVLGGKFTRYFTFVEPLVLIIAAIGFCFVVKFLTEKLFGNSQVRGYAQAVLLIVVLATQLTNSLAVTPHFRLFTNLIGSSLAPVGSYFPHDEFYDAATRKIVEKIIATAHPGAVTYCETPGLFAHYAERLGSRDLRFTSLSDRSNLGKLVGTGDFIVLVEGRRYVSNSEYVEYFKSSLTAPEEVRINGILAARIYKLENVDENAIRRIATGSVPPA